MDCGWEADEKELSMEESIYGKEKIYTCPKCYSHYLDYLFVQKKEMTSHDGKLKIDKQKFIDAMEYIRRINEYNLDDLDLSEFTDTNLDEERKEWKFIGLNNRDFVLYIYNKYVLHIEE
jgi:hypothetical protein